MNRGHQAPQARRHGADPIRSSVDLGAFLQVRRTERGLTQRGLAKTIGIRPSSLARIEHGMVGQPKTRTLAAFAAALKIDYVDLLIMAGHPVPPRRRQRHRAVDLIGPVTEDEAAALRLYLDFLRARHGHSHPR